MSCRRRPAPLCGRLYPFIAALRDPIYYIFSIRVAQLTRVMQEMHVAYRLAIGG